MGALIRMRRLGQRDPMDRWADRAQAATLCGPMWRRRCSDRNMDRTWATIARGVRTHVYRIHTVSLSESGHTRRRLSNVCDCYIHLDLLLLLLDRLGCNLNFAVVSFWFC